MSGIRVKVWGDYALFSRPEFKVESVSYDVITPSAARGILDAIHFKPAICWVIDQIRILKPVRYLQICRNEVSKKLSVKTATKAIKDGKEAALIVEDDRLQRSSMVLRDVAYVIDAHFELTPKSGPGDNIGKHADMARRRIARGQCAYQPCFGTREFPAHFAPVDPAEPLPIPAGFVGERKLGWMLHSLDYRDPLIPIPRFFDATVTDAVLKVPAQPFGAVP
jgi:CRISPR-associated protein Cas5d